MRPWEDEVEYYSRYINLPRIRHFDESLWFVECYLVFEAGFGLNPNSLRRRKAFVFPWQIAESYLKNVSADEAPPP